MSKINAVRPINVNYNNNAYRISDETLHFNGKSTLISLQNGGGKSVLVQMLTAPFVHPKYRNTKDRLFESYFTTNKPSFILVEWALDRVQAMFSQVLWSENPRIWKRTEKRIWILLELSVNIRAPVFRISTTFL